MDKKTYIQIIHLWKSLCEKHGELFEATCEEYSCLLKSEIERLEEVITHKQEIIAEIAQLDTKRKKFIKIINQEREEEGQKPLKRSSELIRFIEQKSELSDEGLLSGYNSLLIDLIEKIQEQNKKNQIFLTKALDSLRDLRQKAQGKVSYNTYNKMGRSVEVIHER